MIRSTTARCESTKSRAAISGSTIPTIRSSKCVTPVKKCRTRSSICSGLCVRLEPERISINRHRRNGASGENALQCASGRVPKARLNVG